MALSCTRPDAAWKAIEPAMVVEPLNVAGPLTVRADKVEVAAEKAPPIVALPELVRLLAETGPETLRVPSIVVLPEANVPADRLPKPASEVPVKFWLGTAG